MNVEKVDFNHLVSLDFETYFDTDYTLKKLSTSEYIRHDLFKIQMVGLKIGRQTTKVLTPEKAKKVLLDLDWTKYSLLCHNTAFDGFILSHHYGIIPRRYYDTLSMVRGLHSNEIGAGLDEAAKFYKGEGKIDGLLEKTKGIRDWPKEMFDLVTPYCARDVDEMLRIFKLMVVKMPVDEMDLINLTIRMFCKPLLHIDIPRVQAEYQREVEKRETLFFSVVPPKDYDIGGKKHDPSFFKKTVLKTGKERALTGIDRDILICRRLLGNNEFFAAMLAEEGVKAPTKISPAWMKQENPEDSKLSQYNYAFAKDDLEFTSIPENIDLWRGELDSNCEDDLPKIAAKQARLQALVDARLTVKSTSNITRAERFLEAGKNNLPLPVGYSYYRAHTGRWGGNNKMNMQNLARGGELRLSILAPPGHQICVVDSGQIEARVNAWLWGQDDLLEAFRKADTWDKANGIARGDNRDAYCRFADSIYGREITTEDKIERFVGKVCVLGLGYQMGAPKFQSTLAKGALGGPPVFFTEQECRRIVNTYRNQNHRIKTGWGICEQIIEEMTLGIKGSYKCLHWEKNTLWLPNGMSLKYPDLQRKTVPYGDIMRTEFSYRSGNMRSKIYGGLLCENIVQALARIIVASQMLHIDLKYPVVMTTHDEIVALPKTEDAEQCFHYMLHCMTTPLAWCLDIPLAAEGGWAQNYSK